MERPAACMAAVLLLHAAAADAEAQPVPVAGAARAVAPVVRQAECATTIKPELLVVSGGLSAESVRPKDGSDAIDKQLAAIRAFVASKGGKLLERERLRAARNPPERDGPARMPFIQVQRIEAEFPTNADVDDILERLLKLGMDRYGKDAALDGHAAPKVLTSYRFTGLDEAMRALAAQCVRTEAQKACGPARAERCVEKANVMSAYAQTEPVANRDGYKRPYPLRVPGVGGSPVESDSLEPLSAAPLRVRLTMTVAFPPNREAP